MEFKMVSKCIVPLMLFFVMSDALYVHPQERQHNQIEEYDTNPHYNFAYDIEDSLTGDSKSQHESRTGDVVQGSYSLIDPDGYRRIVEYTADPHEGFKAVVRREPLGHHH